MADRDEASGSPETSSNGKPGLLPDRDPRLPSAVRWVLVVAVAGIILYSSVVTVPGRDALDPYGPLGILRVDKYLHLGAYAALAAVLAYALVDSRLSNLGVLAAAFLVSAGFGAGIEVVQYGLPRRSLDPADGLVNAAGAALAVLGWRILARLRRARREPAGAQPP